MNAYLWICLILSFVALLGIVYMVCFKTTSHERYQQRIAELDSRQCEMLRNAGFSETQIIKECKHLGIAYYPPH